jgi:hypothetical protein
LALTLFALAGLMVVGKLPPWIVGLVITAGVALGAPLFLLRWLAKRRDPAYPAGRSFGAFALGGALGMLGLASLPIFYLAFWVQRGPTAVPLARLSNGCTLFYEGVTPVAGRPDLTDWFNQTLRGSKQDSSAGYKKLAGIVCRGVLGTAV